MPQQMFSLHDFLKAAKNIAVRMESHEQLLGGYWFLKQLLAGIKEFLVYCGNRTLNVLTFHFVAFKVVSCVLVVVYHEPLNRIAEFPQMRAYASSGWWVLYTFAGVGIPLASKWCIEKIRREK